MLLRPNSLKMSNDIGKSLDELITEQRVKARNTARPATKAHNNYGFKRTFDQRPAYANRGGRFQRFSNQQVRMRFLT